MAHDKALVKRAGNRKRKKLASMTYALEGDDWQFRRILANENRIRRKPPLGKTWVKQPFAGQMGLTLLCAMSGMLAGAPLDGSLFSWDATTSAALHHDMKAEDPYVTVITQPCGPWGNWSRFNLWKGGPAAMTVETNRAKACRVETMVNKTVKDRVRANRHVFVEQWLEEPEMQDVREMIDDGTLVKIDVHGCRLGYHDKESGLPHYKPNTFVNLHARGRGRLQ